MGGGRGGDQLLSSLLEVEEERTHWKFRARGALWVSKQREGRRRKKRSLTTILDETRGED